MITRVDMHENPMGVTVHQFEDGWRTTNSANEAHVNYATSLPDMVSWFRSKGWTVREWPGGARAFLGPARPVRGEGEARVEAKIRKQFAGFNFQLDF